MRQQPGWEDSVDDPTDPATALPRQRSRCPNCYRLPFPDRDCRLCAGDGLVCPTCRGEHVLRLNVEQGNGVYGEQLSVCPTCCDPLLDMSGKLLYERGWPRYRIDTWRMQAAIDADVAAHNPVTAVERWDANVAVETHDAESRGAKRNELVLSTASVEAGDPWAVEQRDELDDDDGVPF